MREARKVHVRDRNFAREKFTFYSTSFTPPLHTDMMRDESLRLTLLPYHKSCSEFSIISLFRSVSIFLFHGKPRIEPPNPLCTMKFDVKLVSFFFFISLLCRFCSMFGSRWKYLMAQIREQWMCVYVCCAPWIFRSRCTFLSSIETISLIQH